MKLFCILLTAILCASASAQTIKTLGFNSTNGQVVANTGTNVLTFTNDVRFASGDLQVSGTQISGSVLLVDFDDGAISGPITINTNSSVDFLGSSAATTRANLGFSTNLNTFWTATNTTNARTGLGFSTNLTSFWTATNAANARSAIGAGTVSEGTEPTFASITISDGDTLNVTGASISSTAATVNFTDGILSWSNRSIIEWGTYSNILVGVPFNVFIGTNNLIQTNAPANTTNVNRWIEIQVGTNSYRLPLYQ